LRYQADFAAGKNKIINGDFGIWQRSTSVTVTTDGEYYAPDRFASTYNQGGATVTWSRQTFTPGTAPVAGYEGTYFNRLSCTSATGTTEMGCNQRIEDVRTFAGQTATFSFWAKADSARTCTILLIQTFGSGGSSSVTVSNTTQALTTSWARYSVTVSVPSISGKTVGTSSSLRAYVYYTSGQVSGTGQLDTWGWQLEAGSVATAFQTATGTIQGELSAAQRYYWRNTSGATYGLLAGAGAIYSATAAQIAVQFPVPMRVAPSAIEFSNIMVQDSASNNFTPSSAGIDAVTSTTYGAGFTCAISTATANRPARLLANNSTTAYIGASAEL
jgi:hypothetical protein